MIETLKFKAISILVILIFFFQTKMDGQTLIESIETGNLQKTKEIIRESPSIVNDTIDDKGMTPLHYAVAKGNTDIAEVLIDNGASINPENPYGITPIFYARKYELAKLLIERGAKLNIQENFQGGRTPLLVAIETNDERIVNLYLLNGADPTIVDDFGKSALAVAIDNGNISIIKLLLEKTNDFSERDLFYHQTLLHRACIYGNVEIIKLLITAGLTINATAKDSKTPIFFAHKYGHQKAVQLLLKNGGNMGNGVDNNKITSHLSKKIDQGDAMIWYLGHSGWAVKTKNKLLIFDYFEYGTLPEVKLFVNGNINSEEINDILTYVFINHAHRDHYDKKILEWKKEIQNINYVFAWYVDLKENPEFMDGGVTIMDGNRIKSELDEMMISKINSNVEPAGAFLLSVDGLNIYHSGDYSGDITPNNDLTYLNNTQPDIDIAFLAPGNRQLAYYTIELLKPKIVFPMHARNYEQVLKSFPGDSSYKHMKVDFCYPDNRGDHFFYSKSKITELIP